MKNRGRPRHRANAPNTGVYEHRDQVVQYGQWTTDMKINNKQTQKEKNMHVGFYLREMKVDSKQAQGHSVLLVFYHFLDFTLFFPCQDICNSSARHYGKPLTPFLPFCDSTFCRV